MPGIELPRSRAYPNRFDFSVETNITVAVPEEVYRKARIRLPSQILRLKEFLMKLADEESEFERLVKLQAQTIASIREFRAGYRLSREDVHSRREVSLIPTFCFMQ